MSVFGSLLDFYAVALPDFPDSERVYVLNTESMCRTAVVARRNPFLTRVLDISNKIDTAEQDDPAEEGKN
ncbi:hypothetical protein AUR64_01885 [Haloprofundus marisrubri]|uniref:Uncharacterized protein n=1 Tax=Haloprofundus marisrubri TaxID=1514971 RepID=A0A0W1R3Q0_9EURY|nr:hypothetical protein AUR64_01885 [Haloprofundus marisrubri]